MSRPIALDYLSINERTTWTIAPAEAFLPDLNLTFDKVADTAFRGIPGVTDAVNIIAAPLLPAHQLQNIGGGVRGSLFLFTVPMF